MSLFGHGVGDVVFFGFIFGDWCVEGMWGGSWCCDSRDCGDPEGVRGIGVIVIVYWEVVGWWCLL